MAIVEVFGDWEESYNDLPKWLGALQHYNPGTIVDLQTRPAYVGNQVIEGSRIFHRLFWTFKPCIDGFRYCKPLVQIDSTLLHGEYKGTLLLAIAQDGNRNIIPIAFAIVEGKTKEAWSFFLTNLRRHVTPQNGICLISDRHEAIESALRHPGSGWLPPDAYPLYCIRHIATNFMRKFNNKDIREQIVNMGYELRRPQFERYYQNLRMQNEDVAKWLDEIPKEKWSQAFDEGRRYGHMTTNLAECINSMLKGTCYLPITALVESTFYKLVDIYVPMGSKQLRMMEAGHTYCEDFMKTMQENRRKANSHFVHDCTSSNSTHIVKESIDPQEGPPAMTYKVNLVERWCDCGKFQSLKFPCSHVIALCAHVHVDCFQYVDNIYRLDTIFKVYELEFNPIRNEFYWPKHHGPIVCHDPTMRRDPSDRPK